MQRFHPIFTGELKVRDRPDDIRPQLQGLFQQRLAVGVREDPLLRKSDNLQLDPWRHLLFDLQHRLQRRQRRIGDIDMGTDKLHAIGDLPLEGFPRPGFNVFMAEQRFPLRPALNPLKQSAGLVPVWLAGRLGGIQMDMRLNKRRDRQPAASVQHFVAFVPRLPHRRDLAKAPLIYRYLPQAVAVCQAYVLNQPKRRCCHINLSIQYGLFSTQPQSRPTQFLYTKSAKRKSQRFPQLRKIQTNQLYTH